ncbi:OmpP1/FadL family transporter [Aquamicrobium terrae]
MNKKGLAALAAATALSLLGTAAAQAGGFSRGTADTDILFEQGNFNMRTGATFVAPQRGYDTVNIAPGVSVKGTDGKYTEHYVIPSAAIKFNITDDMSCAGTYTTPFGASSVYGPQAIQAELTFTAGRKGTMATKFSTNEFGLTCGYKFNVGPGNLWVLGGVFAEDFTYSETVLLGGAAPATLGFKDDYRAGYRIGAAYEIPEYALRAQVLYRSEVKHKPDGTWSSAAFPVTFDTFGTGTLPQSLELKVQTGIAPGWLAFASVKWTDWSVLQTLDYTIVAPPTVGGGDNRKEYFFRDGWTVTGGIGHKFTDSISGFVSLTWDRGVSTTEDALTDTYILAGGVSLTDVLGGELRFGGAVSYLTGRTVPQAALGSGGVGPGHSFGYTVDGDVSYAGQVSFKTKW